MKIFFVCKAAVNLGLGHLIRTRSLATQFVKLQPKASIKLILIGDVKLEKLLVNSNLDYELLENENELSIDDNIDLLFFDMLEMSSSNFDKITSKSRLSISLSPIFNQMRNVDLLFSRTIYQKELNPGPKYVYKGLEYSIIQDDCEKIKTSIYEDNLNLDQFPVAISMGGADAENKTLQFVKSLKDCKVPATFWVMLGEGYKHSFDELINAYANEDMKHEIILCKTNRSMWHVLKNCLFVILPGGITTYEAAYAGLPSINVLTKSSSQFLLQELEEKQACFYEGLLNDETLGKLNTRIEYFYNNRYDLLDMHIRSKKLIKLKGGELILARCLERLEEC